MHRTCSAELDWKAGYIQPTVCEATICNFFADDDGEKAMVDAARVHDVTLILPVLSSKAPCACHS
jgi:hypothetical protein